MKKNQKHIVILTYKFPPHSQVGGRRPYYFAKYLTKLGYKVTIITSDEELKPNRTWDTSIDFVNIIKLKKIQTPNDYSFAQVIISKLYWFLSKKQALFSSVAWKIGQIFLPLDFNNRLDFNELDLSKTIGKIDFIIATGGPWLMFEYGVRLKNVSNAKLILDYRDVWVTENKKVYIESLNNYGRGLFGKIVIKTLLKRELLFLNNSNLVISVSEPIVADLKSKSNMLVSLIYNGFDFTEIEFCKKSENDKLQLSFIGQLRKEQNICKLLDALSIIKANNLDVFNNLQINFIGVKLSPKVVVNEIRNAKLNTIVKLTSFLAKRDALHFMINSNILILSSYQDTEGIVSSKIFQYISANNPILLISNTDDIMEKIISETNTGVICKNKNEIVDYITKMYLLWKENKPLPYNPNIEKVNKYSFENQVGILNKALMKL